MQSENVIQMARVKKAFIDLYKPPTTSNKLIIPILKSINWYNILSRARTILASGIDDTSQYRAVSYSPDTFPDIGPDARSCDSVHADGPKAVDLTRIPARPSKHDFTRGDEQHLLTSYI